MANDRLHGPLLGQAFEHVLGSAQTGSMAFVRCLTPDVVADLCADRGFAPEGWQVWRVAKEGDVDTRTMTADEAVERREEKRGATLLLVDTAGAGAGMDGIYSAALEIREAPLFKEARQLAAGQITKRHSAGVRQYAERALAAARGRGNRHAVSEWAVFDYLCRVAGGEGLPGAQLHRIGLWPVRDDEGAVWREDLEQSRLFVDRLLGPASARLAPSRRVEALNLDDPDSDDGAALRRLLNSVDTQPLSVALERVADNQSLWIGALRTKPPSRSLEAIKLKSWRTPGGLIAKTSGLVEEDGDEPPALIVDPNPAKGSKLSALNVQWSAEPATVEERAIEYRVAVLTDLDEELAFQVVPHKANKGGERCSFGADDFPFLQEDSRLPAKVVVSVVGNDSVESQESEEFIIRCGTSPEQERGSVAKNVRTFSEGIAELSREVASSLVINPTVKTDAKGFLVLRAPVEGGKRASYKVHRPPLIKEAEADWLARGGPICRWVAQVRESGQWAGKLEFVPFGGGAGQAWGRALAASHKLVSRFQGVGGAGQIYDGEVGFETPQEYLRAWSALLETGDPMLALAHTVEVQSLSGRSIGLIVLPAHPLRVAWAAAYDNLVLHTAFDLGQRAKDIREEFNGLDGAMFPAFLPNPHGGAFVFADTLGFHAVGMVPDSDREPKAAVAVLGRALNDAASSADSAPTVGKQSAKVLGNEIVKYLDCHESARLLHIHALRAGDGFTIARSLGEVHERYRPDTGDQDVEPATSNAPVFSLNLFPSSDQRAIAGRFIAEAREKRRSGAGTLQVEDRWMLESLSLPSGVNMPRLRWARKEPEEPGQQANPSTAAHLAIAFDTFESQVVADSNGPIAPHPYHAFGLMSFYERQYAGLPSPMWRNAVPTPTEGEKHPARRRHTETLVRLQDAVHSAVVRHVGDHADGRRPILRTEITPEKDKDLKDLHRLCDWVVTLDRNAGIEYFDSPTDNKDVYDAYVIDCVPEREDLGCLQLITSTANLDEVRGLLDEALDQMGLSRSRRNAEFLLENLKALSGRLAIRLTGQKPATSELIALAVSHANCLLAKADDECWMSLSEGFVVPVDDVRDLLPPLRASGGGGSTRPDLIYVSLPPRSGLTFQFIEVKYRRDLRSARSPDVLNQIREQTRTLRHSWEDWYGLEVCGPFRAIRRAKLARVLRFYADKARRHQLPPEKHQELTAEIHKMIFQGASYAFGEALADRGWVFCPEYVPHDPMEISPHDWYTRVFLIGPNKLPDLLAGPDSAARPSPQAVSGGGDEDARAPDHVPATNASAPAAVDSTERVPAISLGRDSFSDDPLEWQLDVKGNPHLLIAGLPGMGKTTCLVNMCKQMVAAGVRPIVFSYHEDIDAGIADRSSGSVRFIDFEGLGFNPLRIHGQQSKTAYLDVAGTIRDIFAAIFPELGDIQGDRIRRAIKESFVEGGWEDATTSDNDVPAFRRFLEILQSDPKPDRGLRGLLTRLEELDDYGFFNPSADQSSLWDAEEPIIVRIHASQNDTLQRAFASFVFYRLYKDMFVRGTQGRITHAIVFDEAHRAARLKLLPTMAKECRKYGLSLVVASQEASDFNTSLFSAIANYLVLRLTDTDARFLARNVTSSHQEKVLIDKIKGMDRFKGMFFAEGETRPRSVALHSGDEGQVLAAIKRYQKGDISTGAAAEWAGIPKPLLLMKLGEHGIDTFDMSEEELRKELDSGRRFL